LRTGHHFSVFPGNILVTKEEEEQECLVPKEGGIRARKVGICRGRALILEGEKEEKMSEGRSEGGGGKSSPKTKVNSIEDEIMNRLSHY